MEKNKIEEAANKLDDIDTVGTCANCGVEFHIHKNFQDEPANPPDPEEKWKRIIKELSPMKEDISRKVDEVWLDFFKNGVTKDSIRSLIQWGFSLKDRIIK